MRMRRLSSTTSIGDGGGRGDGGGGIDSGVDDCGAEDDCSGSGGTKGTDRGPAAAWRRVCGAGEVTDGQICRFDDGRGGHIMIINQGGRMYAADAVCTHADADLSAGFLGPDGVRCPLHLSVFDLETGRPQNPPAEEALRVYNVRVDDGQVYVEV